MLLISLITLRTLIKAALMQNVFFGIGHALTQGTMTIAFLRGHCLGNFSEEIIFLSYTFCNVFPCFCYARLFFFTGGPHLRM